MSGNVGLVSVAEADIYADIYTGSMCISARCVNEVTNEPFTSALQPLCRPCCVKFSSSAASSLQCGLHTFKII